MIFEISRSYTPAYQKGRRVVHINSLVRISPSQVQLFTFTSFLMCTLVLILALQVSAVRHLQVLGTYLLAETAALFCSDIFCPVSCLFNIG
jgi:hypothetical protein